MTSNIRYVPNHKSFGAFIMTREGNPAAAEAESMARKIAFLANYSALMWTTEPKQRRRWQRLRINPMAMGKLAGSYKVAETAWVSSREKTPRASYVVYSDDKAAPFNEFGGGEHKTSPEPRHILRNAAILVAQSGGAGRSRKW